MTMLVPAYPSEYPRLGRLDYNPAYAGLTAPARGTASRCRWAPPTRSTVTPSAST